MAKTRLQKETIVSQLKEKFARAKSILFVSFSGITIKATDELKKSAQGVDVEYTVAKKTLLKVALEGQASDMPDATTLPGNIAVLMSYGDEVSGAKVAAKFAKTHEGFKLLGGILEARFIDAAATKALAAIPSRLELLAKLVGSLQAPISGFVNVQAGLFRNFVGVLNAIGKSKS